MPNKIKTVIVKMDLIKTITYFWTVVTFQKLTEADNKGTVYKSAGVSVFVVTPVSSRTDKSEPYGAHKSKEEKSPNGLC